MPAFRPATVALAAVALALPAIAQAAPPTHDAFTVDATFRSAHYSRACGFPVYRHQTGTVRIALFHNGAGDVVRELDTAPDFKTLWFSPVALGGTGGSFLTPDVAPARTTYPDGVYLGAPATVIFNGLQGRAPGAPQAGHDVYAAEVAFIDEAGVPFNDIIASVDARGNFSDAATFEAAVCDALAAP